VCSLCSRVVRQVCKKVVWQKRRVAVQVTQVAVGDQEVRAVHTSGEAGRSMVGGS